MELPVLKIDGTPSGKNVTLEEGVFGIQPNDHAIYLDVVQYLANQRHGNAKTKDRSENAHSTKKLGRQKGGGGARHGSLKANIFVGGGRVFGPQPRFYHNKLNKKVKALARKSALSYKANENAIIMLEPFTMDAPKTKELLNITAAIKAGDRKVLYVLPENSTNIYLSSRNLPQVNVTTVDEINTYAIMNARTLVLVDGVQDILAERNMRYTTQKMGIIIKPIVTEKLTAQGEKLNRYGFIVDRKANKLQIKEAVEKMFNVSVADVNTVNYHGKRKSRYSKSGMLRGRMNHFKKAYVTLAGEDKIDFYANI